MAMLDSAGLLRRLLGLRHVSVLQPLVIYEDHEPLRIPDYLAIELCDEQLLICNTSQSDVSIHICDRDDAVGRIPNEDGDEIEFSPLVQVAESVDSISEVWVRCNTPHPYLTDGVLWNGSGRPFLHVQMEDDEFNVRPIVTFPESVSRLSLDAFYGSVVQVRYRGSHDDVTIR